MAKNKKSKRRPTDTGASAVAVAQEPDGQPSEEHSAGLSQVSTAPSAAPTATSGGFFSLYKPGQGYFTRVGTAAGAALIVVFGANYLYGRLPEENVVLQMGIPAAALAIGLTLVYWIVGVNRKSNEFFIATEGEMKKVSWSTRKEVIGSTKVVLMFTLLMATLLFVVDIFFMFLFSSIDVLQVDLKSLIGI